MKNFLISILVLPLFLFVNSCNQGTAQGDRIILKDNWTIQSSAETDAEGPAISSPEFEPGGWYPATMPSTVLAALVKNGVYPDPYFGTNIEKIPGAISGRRREMPDDSPFRVPWWYRTVFRLPADYLDQQVWIHFNSINYRANIWVNGRLLADTIEVEGAYRQYDLDMTEYVAPGSENCLALEIFPPKGMDLTITWVDWNPTPPDRGMGIWYDVSVRATGKVAIEHPHVITDLDLPSLDVSDLVYLINYLYKGGPAPDCP